MPCTVSPASFIPPQSKENAGTMTEPHHSPQGTPLKIWWLTVKNILKCSTMAEWWVEILCSFQERLFSFLPFLKTVSCCVTHRMLSAFYKPLPFLMLWERADCTRRESSLLWDPGVAQQMGRWSVQWKGNLLYGQDDTFVSCFPIHSQGFLQYSIFLIKNTDRKIGIW